MNGDDTYKDYPFPGGWHLIPPYMREGVYNYVMYGRPTGSFLTSIIANDYISDVWAKADENNRRFMDGWMQFLYNFFPREAHGTRAAVVAWCSHKGMEGKIK